MPDPDRIAARLQDLWAIASGPGGGADRPAFSAAEAQAMRLVAGWAREQGLAPGIDPHGNLWALPEGWPGPVVTAGSHVDTVPDGGRYDGALGTVLGLELAAGLRDETPDGARAGVLVCAAEEAPRFGAGTVGSRLLVGTLQPAALAGLHDAAGVSAADAQARYLDALADLPRVAPPVDRLRRHAEIHVAQRRTLRELGIVRRVASPRRFAITVGGRAGHAGEVSMEERRDALAAAAALILEVERAARAEPPETVATVGTVAVSPGAVSVIPEQVRLGIDVRGIDAASLQSFDTALRRAAGEVASQRDVTIGIEVLRTGDPVELDAGLAGEALAAARALSIPATETWSGSGHDAQHLSAIVPALLVFVPLHGGESHTPQEGAAMDEIVQATAVVARVLSRPLLDSGGPV